jgi:glyoxylase-like metal-dependent hydrolase (beta-lactamase superfamily II)
MFLRTLALGPMQNFVYLVGPEDGREAAVVDPAWDVPAILRAAAEAGREVVAALLTHGHRDHVNGLDELLAARPGLRAFAHPAEIAFRPPLAALGDAVVPVPDGGTVPVGALAVTAIHTPGHTPGALCFRAGERLFTGDTLFVGACGRCDLPGGDPERMFDSLHRTLGALPGELQLLPGHDYGPVPTRTLAEERRENPYLRAGERDAFVALRGRPRA